MAVGDHSQNDPAKVESSTNQARSAADNSNAFSETGLAGPAGKGIEQQKPTDTAGDGASPHLALDKIGNPVLPSGAANQADLIRQLTDAKTPTGAGQQTQLTSADGSRVSGFEGFDKNTGQRSFYAANQDGSPGYTAYRFNNDRSSLVPVNEGAKPIALRQNSDSNQSNQPGQEAVTLKGQVSLDSRPNPQNSAELTEKGNQTAQQERLQQSDQAKDNTAKAQNENKAQFTDELKNMDPQKRIDLIDKSSNQLAPKLDSTHEHQGKPGKDGGADTHAERGEKHHHDKHEHGKPEHGKHHQIDGKLLAQLQGLGRFPDQRKNFIELIDKFQDGKLSPKGKEGGLNSILQGLKGEINGLKAWLTDGKKNPFDFKGLDTEKQQNISKVFDSLSGRGQENATAAMLDAKGMRNALSQSTDMPSRTLGGEKGQTDFKINGKELDQTLQGIIARLQGKEALSADRTLSSKLDSNQGDAKPGVKLSDSAKDALANLGAVTRGLGQRDTQTRAGDEKQGGAPESKADKGQALSPEQVAAALSGHMTGELDEAAQKQINEAKQKQLDEEQEKAEKEKKDEKKKQSDEERLYIVMPNDTLNSIAKKFFQKTDNAEIIYDRNLENIMLQDYKDQPYAKLYPRQRIIIPNAQYIDTFKKSNKSHKHICFDKIPFASANEELEQMFGKNWTAAGGGAGGGALPGGGTRSSSDNQADSGPINRRSFSGDGATVSDATRRANVHASLGLNTPVGQSTKYNVHLGESLRSIAQKFYKSPAYWRLLAIKNNLSTATDQRGNPVTLLRRGQQLTLPEPSELESFSRNPESPGVVALLTDDRGMVLPRTRQCGYCKRNTLAMATNCVACGLGMDTYVPGEEGADETSGGNNNKNNQAAVDSRVALADVFEQGASVPLQEVTLTNKFQPMNFSPEHPQPQEATVVSHPQPPHDPHPLPHADLSEVEFGFEEEADPMWTPSKEPVLLDQHVRIVESATMEGDVRGLIVFLQLFSEGQWITVFDYHVRPDDVVIHKYQRTGGRRLMKKSLSAAQSKQMAWNHFRANWQAICSEFWST